MAKVTLTLEDTSDGDNVIVSLDMGGAKVNTFGSLLPTRAIRMSQKLFDQAATMEAMRVVPACSRQPGTPTIH